MTDSYESPDNQQGSSLFVPSGLRRISSKFYINLTCLSAVAFKRRRNPSTTERRIPSNREMIQSDLIGDYETLITLGNQGKTYIIYPPYK